MNAPQVDPDRAPDSARQLLRTALAGARRLPRALLDALAPQRCVYCDQRSDPALPLCGVCESLLRRNTNPCPRCALPDCGGSLCPTCLAQPPSFASVTAPLVYDPAVAYLMHRWKYLKERRFVDIGVHLLRNNQNFMRKVDIILPTPLHWRRQLQRGFNQSEDLLDALCRADSRFRNLRTRGMRLQRVKSTAAQASSTRAARLGNLRGAFHVRGNPQGLAVGVVDDVCTTGATAGAMAAALREAGAYSVHLLCIARTPDR